MTTWRLSKLEKLPGWIVWATEEDGTQTVYFPTVDQTLAWAGSLIGKGL